MNNLSVYSLLLLIALPVMAFAQSGDQAPAVKRMPPQTAGPAPLKTGLPNSWFNHTKLFMGDFLDEEEVKGLFSFENPTAEQQHFSDLLGSCQCARVVIIIGDRKYELSKEPEVNSLHRISIRDGKEIKEKVKRINVPAGAKGTIEVFMSMDGYQGLKDATLAMSTSDPAFRNIQLHWQARGVNVFELNPPEVFLNTMQWNEQKTFAFEVSSSTNPDFKLLDHDPLPEYVKVEKEQVTLASGKPGWRITGIYGPKADPRHGGAQIRFKTDWKDRHVKFTVIANVVGPMEIKPGTFMQFGKVRRAEGAEVSVTLTPNTGLDLKIEKYEFQGLSIDEKFLSLTHERDGDSLVVKLKVQPNAMGNLLRGRFLLYLNQPGMEPKEFAFNGFIR